jgi:hypothetical protein
MIHGRRDQIWMQKRIQRKAQREEHVGMLTYIWQTINDVTAMGEDRTTQGAAVRSSCARTLAVDRR